MPTYLHPGVYVEEIPSGARPIEAVGTSTAAFIGFTTKGPLDSPELIFKFEDFVSRYGGVRDLGAGAQGDAMGLSVSAFFQNGGSKAYIVRLAKEAARARGVMAHPDAGNTTDGLELTAVNEGVWADGLAVRLSEKEANPELYTVEIGRLDSRGRLQALETFGDVSLDSASPRFIEAVVNGVSESVTVALKALAAIATPAGYFLGTSVSGGLAGEDLDLSTAAETARRLTLSLDGQASFNVTLPAADFTGKLGLVAAEIQAQTQAGATNPRQTFTCEVVGSTLVLTSGTREAASAVVVSGSGVAATLKLGIANGGTEQTGAAAAAARIAETAAELVGGDDGKTADDSAYKAIFTQFEKIRDISIVCLPGKAWDAAGKAVIQEALSHAEKVKSRMVIVDPPAAEELIKEKDITDLGLPTSTYSVLYYPWVKVANPFFDEEDNPGVPTTLLAPPSGYAAGMWSKIDGRRGVWKAPAGVEANLLGLAGFEFVVEDAEQDQLNPLGVNAYRNLPGFGSVVWGSRTLSTRADPEWRYVPVRRTAIFIEGSIFGGIQWAVFEPNDHRLWSSLRLNIEDFMNGLFRSGAFQGEKASDAYFVRCGLGDTMTQADIDRGQVIVIVGFAPLKPAEFVIVRIQQKVAQQ